MDIFGINCCHTDGNVEYFHGLETSTNTFACTECCYARVRGVPVYGTITSIFKSGGKFYAEIRLLLVPKNRRFKGDFDTPSQPIELLQSDCIEEISANDIIGKLYLIHSPMHIDKTEEMSAYLRAEFLVQDFEEGDLQWDKKTLVGFCQYAMVKESLVEAIPPKFVEDFDSFVYSQCNKDHHFFGYITKTLNLSKKDVSVFGPTAANETTSDRMRRRLNNFSSAKKERLLLAYTLIRGGYSNPWLFYSKFKSCNEH